MKKIKNEKAITLIALVITIIVLLILAGVAISMLTGDNGILKKAVEAKESTEDAQVREQIQLAVASARMINNGNLTEDALNTELKNTFGEGNYTLTKETDEEGNQTGFLVKVGNVEEYIEEKVAAKPRVITATDVNADIIGATVTNYKPTADQETEWRIFFADEEHIYLIAKNYISVENLPSKDNAKPENKNANYPKTASFDEVYSKYTGSKDIMDNDTLKSTIPTYHKWLKNSNSTEKRIRSIAYMLDTEIWTKQYGTNDAEYVIGGPTIEMFCKSYNTKGGHNEGKEKIVVDENLTRGGYRFKFENSGSSFDQYLISLDVSEFENLYVISSAAEASRYWLPSPDGYIPSDLDEHECIIVVTNSGSLSFLDIAKSDDDLRSAGFRPIVCLKSNIQLQEIEKGTKYEIIN